MSRDHEDQPRPFHTELPPSGAAGNGRSAASGDPGDIPALPALPAPGPEAPAIPRTPLAAYRAAAASIRRSHPESLLPWELLAAIGMVESGHAWGGAVDGAGTMLEPITGERQGYEAVGPMRLSSALWTLWGVAGRRDGGPDPQNLYDAALSTGHYLCDLGGDLSRAENLHAVIRSFHDSPAYLRAVLTWMESYREAVREIPDRAEIRRSDPAPVPPAADGAEAPEPVEAVEAVEAAKPSEPVESPDDGSPAVTGRPKWYGRTRPPAAAGQTGPPGKPGSRSRRRLLRGAAGAALGAALLFGFPGPQLADLLDDPSPGISEGDTPRALPDVPSPSPDRRDPEEKATPTPEPEPKPKPEREPEPEPKPEPRPSETEAPAAADTSGDSDGARAQSGDGSPDDSPTYEGPEEPAPEPSPTRHAPGTGYYDWTKWLPGGR